MHRMAQQSDLKSCVKMGLEFVEMAGFTSDEGKVVQTIQGLIDNDSLIVSGNPPTGMIGGLIYPHYFNNEMIAQ